MNKIGMLWYSNEKETLSEKVGKAIAYYEKKYGRKPTLVICNKKDYEEISGIAIRHSRSIPPNNFWLGMEE